MKPSQVPRLSYFALSFLGLALCLMPGCGGTGGSGGSGGSNNPIPSLSKIEPSVAIVGSNAITITVTGRGMLSSSQVSWNGTMLTTTVNSSSEVQAQVPASSLATADTATVAVVNPAPGGGKSNELSFVVKSITTNVSVLDVEGNDLAWDTQRQLIYVSVPSTATNNANTITIVNPVAGQIVRSQATNPEPGVLSLSDDGQFLYAVIGGDSAVQRFTMPALTPDIKWTVGSDPIFGTYVPTDVEAMPGAPHTVAVVRGLPLSTRSAGGVVIYDDGVARPTSVCGLGSFCDSLKWKSDGSELFAEDNSSSTRFFYRLGVNAAGLNVLQESGGVFRAWGTNLHLDPQTNYVYTDSGETVDAKKGLPVGNYAAGPVGRPAYSGVLAAIDSGLKRIFFVAPVQD
jgi:hypothetical protein